MIYPSLDELARFADNRYTLVTASAKRAREILDEKKGEDEEHSIKAVSQALLDINSGKVQIEVPKPGIK